MTPIDDILQEIKAAYSVAKHLKPMSVEQLRG